jgi:Kef-type K+ transport system membrane component KefB
MSALATQIIGIHAIFGAFLAGAIIPHGSRLANELSIRLRDSVTILLLPAFFAFTGMRTQIGLISGWENWLVCG